MGHSRGLTSIFTAIVLAGMSLAGCGGGNNNRRVDQDKTRAADINALLPADKTPGHAKDSQIFDMVECQTLKYFTDYADRDSGMARERSNGAKIYGANIVTAGGTGFGVMGMTVGVERGCMTREDAVARITKIVDFLNEKGHAADYHGMFPHFMDGKTGKNFVWFEKSPSADLVETSYLMMGLLTARQYFNGDNPAEKSLRAKITTMWEACDWSFYTNGQNQLYWHWSPTQGFGRLPIRGWNEALITYVLAASSPTHPISIESYNHGWSRDGAMQQEQTCENLSLPLGQNQCGGPLFWSQYSFMGLDPNGLKDKFADYGQQTRNHALINFAYAVRNPRHFKGYGANAWGLTASDGPPNADGSPSYDAYSTVNDRGVIAPTAALSSFPYTPIQSMAALRHYFNDYGGKLWGSQKDGLYGFVDSFSEGQNWQAGTDLAIDEGPIPVMMENYRSGLCWHTFMSIPDVKTGLQRLGFQTASAPPKAAGALLSLLPTLIPPFP